MKPAYVMESPIGLLTLVEAEGALAELRFGKNLAGVSLAETPLLLRAAQELQEYFSGQRRSFEVKLAPSGTPFQQKC